MQMFWITYAGQHHQWYTQILDRLARAARVTHVSETGRHIADVCQVHTCKCLEAEQCASLQRDTGMDVAQVVARPWPAVQVCFLLHSSQGLGDQGSGLKATAQQNNQGSVAAKAVNLAKSGMEDQEWKSGRAESHLLPHLPLLNGVGYPLTAKWASLYPHFFRAPCK